MRHGRSRWVDYACGTRLDVHAHATPCDRSRLRHTRNGAASGVRGRAYCADESVDSSLSMRHRPRPHIADRAVAALRRHGFVWLLLLALPLHGLSAAMIGLLGQRHFHEAVQHDVHHAQAHAALQRHHHGRDDASVVAFDPPSLDGVLADAGASGAAPSMLAPPPGARIAARTTGHTPWSARDTGRFVSWSSQPPERPPKV